MKILKNNQAISNLITPTMLYFISADRNFYHMHHIKVWTRENIYETKLQRTFASAGRFRIIEIQNLEDLKA